MSKKKVLIKPTQSFRSKEKDIDDWVSGNFEGTSKKSPNEKKDADDLNVESRFTIVIPKYLHIRVKKYCAINDKNMKVVITDILSKAFPET